MATYKKPSGDAKASKRKPRLKAKTPEERAVKLRRAHADQKAVSRSIKDADPVFSIDKLKPAKKALKHPCVWSDKLGSTLFMYIIMCKSLEDIARMEGMPDVHMLLIWIADPNHPFSELYMRAKSIAVPLLEERALDAARNPGKFTIITKRETPDGRFIDEKIVDNVERSRLIMQAYQWTLGHIRPKKHGPKADGEDGKEPNEQIKALIKALRDGPA